ncbi:MAG: insulinase family protein [Candidatus Kapaibacterium sp.]
MKKLLFILLLSVTVTCVFAQKKYTYETFDSDPMGTRIYKLDNGLTVFMSVNKAEPRITTRIAVKAGSKNDPSDATGLAHYLEHMLFKGTSNFGSKDFNQEGKLINEIIDLYEQHRATTDEQQRKMLYRKIDSVSYLASGYAIPNEYDKMLASIGATGTNAYTSNEQTVYTNEIPSNQLTKWLTIEAERFKEPIMRLFHTELEVVYEEKNRSMDNGSSKAFENLYAGLFQKHTYGTQTTIGTVEHLKNPSLKKVINYFNTYYVPNNMAIILAGDFNPDEAIKLIDEKFGSTPSKVVPEFIPAVEEPIASPVEKTVYSPEAESILLGFRLPGATTDEFDVMSMMSSILYNGSAGLIDLNIVKQQKALNAAAFLDDMMDYSTLIFSATPREGQSLEELKGLLLAEVEKVRKGDFPDWMIEATINNYKLGRVRGFQSNDYRAQAYVSSFTTNIPWDRYYTSLDRLEKVSKQNVVDLANKYLGNNYVVVYKKTGEDKSVQKIVKPDITPVQVNRESESSFLTKMVKEPVTEIAPQFVDYISEISQFSLKPGVDVYSMKNKENNLFEMAFIFEFGNNADKKLSTALSYLKLVGTKDMNATEISQEFYRLGCSFNANQSGDRMQISLNGLSENYKSALNLLMELLANAVPDEAAYKNLVDDILKSRTNAKLSKNTILRGALTNWGIHGAINPMTTQITESELKNMNPSELTDMLKTLIRYKHSITYYGPLEKDEFEKTTGLYYKTKELPMSPPANRKFEELATTENKVYFVDYKMKQVEIMFLHRGEMFDAKSIPIITLYNEYFGGGMSSIVFQDLREAKALAYSVSSRYGIPDSKDKNFMMTSYIGTQSDKLGEAMTGFDVLLNDMPMSDVTFGAAKDGVLKNIQTERILRSDVLRSYLSSKRQGIDYDIRKDVYENVNKYNLNDVKSFNDKYIKGNKYVYLVIGDKSKLDFSILEKYGKVEELTLEQVFGY